MSTPPFVRLPVGVERVEVATRRGKLVGLRAEADGPSVILVPGFTGSKEDFIAVLEPLRDLGWSVLAIDQLGQFESTGPDDEGAYSLDALSEDLAALAEGLHGPVHLVGHSLGGVVCRQATIARPELFASLTFLGTGPGPLPTGNHHMLKALLGAIPRLSLERIWHIKLKQDVAAGIPQPPPAILDFLHERWIRTNGWALSATARLLMELPDRTAELLHVARTADVRIMVAFGSGDTDAWPVHEQIEMAARLDATCVEIPDAEHSPAAENPADTAAVLDRFWRNHHQ
ncbi:MAG: alpha/beta fold hydrolase [Candidatus Nanopelagicales bacterium]|nr:alpha/beta fold hydrolase [Candidatus Nanopelagicales bacterium]